MTEHIWRLSAVWLGFENPASKWTSVNPAIWIPKMSWALKPEFEEAVDDGSYWVIDEVFDSETTKNFSKLSLEWNLRDDLSGYLFAPTLWTYQSVQAFTGTTAWSPARGDIVYQWASFGVATWVWVIKKIQIITWPVTLYRVSTTSWTLANWTDIKEESDVYTLATVDTTTYASAKWHFFSRDNTNSHPTVTMYDNDPVATQKSTYWMINSLEISASVGEYVKFTAELWGKKMESGWVQTPSYTTQTEFIARDAKVYFADTESDLNSATASCMQSFKVNFNKNLKEIQCFGSDDIDSIHNQQFTIDWDMEAIFDSETLRGYVINSTKKAFRMELINTTATAIVAWVYPSIIIDGMKAWFNSRDKSDSNNDIVTQTMWFTGQYDTTTSATTEILLITDTATPYEYV